MAICISICNESYADFQLTVKALLRNLSYLFRSHDKISQDQVVIFLIQDGIEKIPTSFISQASG